MLRTRNALRFLNCQLLVYQEVNLLFCVSRLARAEPTLSSDAAIQAVPKVDRILFTLVLSTSKPVGHNERFLFLPFLFCVIGLAGDSEHTSTTCAMTMHF